jgi:CDP-diacylglycerol---serine O-phosphatidyltransferase
MLDFEIAGADIRWLAWCITLFAGLTMVSNIPYYSGKEINLRKSVPFITVLLLALFFFVLIPSHPPVVLFCLFFLYALSGYFLRMWRWFKKKRTTSESQ